MHGQKLLKPEADQLGRYVRAVFKYALPGGIISLRAFPQNKPGPAIFIRPFEVEGEGFGSIITGAITAASDAAKAVAVFSPPVATFKDHRKASVANLAEGLVLSVECDAYPQEALLILKRILGAPTLIVESGGVWLNPNNGVVENKLHLYWRLSTPARDNEGFAKLKEALKIATGLVGADTSNTTIVHPLRWPGSWHLKAEPRLCHIVSETDQEIDLDEALKLLRAAAPADLVQNAAREARQHRNPSRPRDNKWSLESVDLEGIADAMRFIPNDSNTPDQTKRVEWPHWKAMGLRIYAATGGSEEGFRIFSEWSKTGKKYNEANTIEAWEEIKRSPPGYTGAGAIFNLAKTHGWRRTPQIKVKVAPEIASESAVKRKRALPFMDGVVKIGDRIGFFFDEVVRNKGRNHFIDFGVEAKCGPAVKPPRRKEDESDEAFAKRRRIAHETMWTRVLSIVGPPGSRKSSTARAEAAKRIHAGLLSKGVTLLQRLDFSEEYRLEYATLGIDAEILRGRAREKVDRDGVVIEATCLNMDAVDTATDCGLKVSEFVCADCRFKDDCSYMKTMKLEPQMWIAATNYLFHEQRVLKGADFVIIDEGFSSRGIVEDVERNSVPLDALALQTKEPKRGSQQGWRRTLYDVATAQKGNGGVEQDAIIEAFTGLVAGVLKPGERIRLTVELRDAEIAEREVLREVLQPRLKGILDAPKSRARQKMQSEVIRDIQFTQTMIRVFHELRQFVDMQSRDQREDAPIRSGRVLVEKIGNDASKLLIWRGINKITKQFHVPVLLLNVEHQKEIIEAFFPQVESPLIVEMELPENIEVPQIFGAPTSSTKIGDPRKRSWESDESFKVRCQKVEENRQEVLTFIIEKWREAGSPNAVVFCQLAFEHWIRTKLPEGIRVDHYGNLSGTNDYNEVDLAFLVGRALPGPKAVESAACAISGLQVESIIGDNPRSFYWYQPDVAEIEMRDGSVVEGRGHTHPDPLCRALISTILSELLQAFGRPRPWGRKRPLKVMLLLDEAVPGAVVKNIDQWPEPSPFDAQIAGGIMVSSEVDLMRLWPETFTSVATTRRYIKALKVPEGWRCFTYHLKGQRGGRPKGGWYDPNGHVSDPQAWLIERLGALSVYGEERRRSETL